MNKRPTFEDLKKKALQDKEVQTEYDLLAIEFALLEKSIIALKKFVIINLHEQEQKKALL